MAAPLLMGHVVHGVAFFCLLVQMVVAARVKVRMSLLSNSSIRESRPEETCTIYNLNDLQANTTLKIQRMIAEQANELCNSSSSDVTSYVDLSIARADAILVAMQPFKICGFFFLTAPFPGTSMRVEMQCSATTHHQKALLRETEAFAKDRAVEYVDLSIVPQDRSFFEEQGYRHCVDPCDSQCKDEELHFKDNTSLTMRKCLQHPSELAPVADTVVSESLESLKEDAAKVGATAEDIDNTLKTALVNLIKSRRSRNSTQRLDEAICCCRRADRCDRDERGDRGTALPRAQERIGHVFGADTYLCCKYVFHECEHLLEKNTQFCESHRQELLSDALEADNLNIECRTDIKTFLGDVHRTIDGTPTLFHDTPIYSVHTGHAVEDVAYNLFIDGKAFPDGTIGSMLFKHRQDVKILWNNMTMEQRAEWKDALKAGELSRGDDTPFARILGDGQLRSCNASFMRTFWKVASGSYASLKRASKLVILVGKSTIEELKTTMFWKGELPAVALYPPGNDIDVISLGGIPCNPLMRTLRSRIEDIVVNAYEEKLKEEWKTFGKDYSFTCTSASVSNPAGRGQSREFIPPVWRHNQSLKEFTIDHLKGQGYQYVHDFIYLHFSLHELIDNDLSVSIDDYLEAVVGSGLHRKGALTAFLQEWYGYPKGNVHTAIFQPGLIGVTYILDSGEITDVEQGGNADKAGVKVGMRMLRVGTMLYTNTRFTAAAQHGTEPYKVTFTGEGYRRSDVRRQSSPDDINELVKLTWVTKRALSIVHKLLEEGADLNKEAPAYFPMSKYASSYDPSGHVFDITPVVLVSGMSRMYCWHPNVGSMIPHRDKDKCKLVKELWNLLVDAGGDVNKTIDGVSTSAYNFYHGTTLRNVFTDYIPAFLSSIPAVPR